MVLNVKPFDDYGGHYLKWKEQDLVFWDVLIVEELSFDEKLFHINKYYNGNAY